MNLRILGLFLGVFQILIAIWYFDWDSWVQLTVSTVLFLSGTSLLVREAGFRSFQKVGIGLLYVGAAIALLLIFKVWFVD